MKYSRITDFIPDLPVGPLDEYRRQASFDWKEMKIIFENTAKSKYKLEIWKTLERDPLFQHSNKLLPGEEQKRIAALRYQKFLKYNFLQRNTAKMPYSVKTKQLMTVNEALVVVFPDVSIKLGLGFSLFTNALLSMGTERHQPIYNAAWNGQISAGFALTEIAHGSNTKDMKTTAIYDVKTQEFVINTPDFTSAKCLVGNLGKTCTIVLVLAQLYAEGECRGLHVFVVPVRDPKTLLPYPGVIVGDVGEKAGINGVDNGFIMFDHYRIPREFLMNRTADVTPEGVYESSFTDPGRILGAALEMLGAARVGIIQENTCIIGSAVTIAVRYAALRKQFRANGGEELSIIEYPLHQWRLFPYVAASCVIKLFTEIFTDIYLLTVERSNSGGKIENLSDMVSEIHAIVSAAKPVITWTCRNAIQECREACGGFGYLKSARLGDMRNDQDPAVTYEGDNNVLIQQTCNWLLRQWTIRHTDGENVISPVGTCSFINHGQEILAYQFEGKAVDDVCNIKFVMDCFKWLICYLARETNKQIDELTKDGGCKFAARNQVQVYRARTLPKVYFEHLALNLYWDDVHKQTGDPNMLSVLERLGLLYGLWSIEKNLIILYEGGYASGPKLVRLVNESVLKLCSDLKPDIVGVVDSLSPPDFALNSVLGRTDGKLYQNIQADFFHNEGNMCRPSWWNDVACPDAPNIQDLYKSKL